MKQIRINNEATLKQLFNNFLVSRQALGIQENIKRSMSRAGTPTDNAVIESINGWIKVEMYAEGWHRRFDTPEKMIHAFVEYYNNERPAFALQYKAPIQYKTELGFL